MNDLKTIFEKIKTIKNIKKDIELATALGIDEIEFKNLKYRNVMSKKAVEVIIQYAKNNFISLDLLFLNRNYDLSLQQKLENLEFDLYEIEDKKNEAEKEFFKLDEEEQKNNISILAEAIHQYEYEYERIIQEASNIDNQINEMYQNYADYLSVCEYPQNEEENRMIKYYKRKRERSTKNPYKIQKSRKINTLFGNTFFPFATSLKLINTLSLLLPTSNSNLRNSK